MDEDRGVEESGVDSVYEHLGLRDHKVEVEIPSVTNRVEEGVELSNRFNDEWVRAAYGEYYVPEIPQIGTNAVPQQSPVPEYQEALPFGVPADGDTDTILGLIGLCQTMSLKDLALVSRIISHELCRRTGAENWDTLAAEVLDVHADVGRAPGSPGSPTFGHSINHN